LKTVEIVTKANKASPISANLNGPGVADLVFGAEELENTLSLTHFLDGRVTGIVYYKERYYLSKNNPHLHDANPKYPPAEPIRIYVNGVHMTADGFNLEDISPLEVESIEILKSITTTSLYGTSAGIILITMKTGKERTDFNTRAPGMLAYNPQGFYKVRQFYSPKYEVKQDEIQDFRPTVFWEPNLVSDANGKAKINYYNTDQAGTFRIVIEGVDGDGNLARKVVTYTVN
jgi:hypothetical protein